MLRYASGAVILVQNVPVLTILADVVDVEYVSRSGFYVGCQERELLCLRSNTTSPSLHTYIVSFISDSDGNCVAIANAWYRSSNARTTTWSLKVALPQSDSGSAVLNRESVGQIKLTRSRRSRHR